MKQLPLLLLLLAACVNYKKYQCQEILEQRNDAQGRLVSKTFQQWISAPPGDRLATMTQEFDTLGRVSREYGFNNPYYYGRRYLVEKKYRGESLCILNKYIWPPGDTLRDFSSPAPHLSEQWIYLDPADPHRVMTVTLSPAANDSLYGYVNDSRPLNAVSWHGGSYSFYLHPHDVIFDTAGRLVLTAARQLK